MSAANKVLLNGKPLSVGLGRRRGAYLKAEMGIGSQRILCIEDGRFDTEVGDLDTVRVMPGMRFYDIPPCGWFKPS